MAAPLFDPQQVPVEALAGEAALAPDRLLAAWLRTRFQMPPPWTPEPFHEHLLRGDQSPPRPASVLVPIVERGQGLTLMLTRRTDHLHDHAGQISFPGGRADDGDTGPVDTALREAEEEVGLARGQVEVLGTMPEYLTVTGYRVTPVVGLLRPPFALQADPFEVAEIFEVPLAFLMDGMHHQRRAAELRQGGGRRHFYAMPYGRHFIWGATAGMLRNLFHFLRA